MERALAVSPSPTLPVTSVPTPVRQTTPTPVVGAIRNRPGVYYERLILQSYPYWFKVHVPPSYRSGVPSALVFSLHGLGSDLEQQELLSGMSTKADEAGFVAVYPQAGASVWNVQSDGLGALHVELFRQLIEMLEVKLSIDPARIYATGFSNGGGMVHRLACDLSDRIAAIAPVAGAHQPEQECRPSRPVPVLAIHGTADRLGPYLNEELGHNIPQWAADWARRNGCDPEPVVRQEGKVRLDAWENCEAGASVFLYSVEEMGHAWPGSPQGDRSGSGIQDLVATDLIWAFFEAHPHP
jgi:polyhydroxybutyrate depolymerase